MDKVGRGCQPHLYLSPVHPILAVDFSRDQAAIREPGYDAGRFVIEMLILFSHQGGSLLRP